MTVAAKRKMTKAKVTKKPAKPRTPRFLDEKYLGPEPDWIDASNMSAAEYYKERCRTGQYYNYFYTPKDGKPWVITWMKDNGYTKEQIASVKVVPDSWVSIIISGYCRALTKGMPVNHEGLPAFLETLPGVSSTCMKDADVYVKTKIEEIIERGTTIKQVKVAEEKKKDIPRPSIQELLRDKSVEMSEDIDKFVDNFDYKKSTLTSFDPLKMLRKVEAKGNHAKWIKSFYEGEFLEYDELLNPPKRMNEAKKEDHAQLKEGYSHLSKSQIKSVHSLYLKILNACDMVIEQSKANRTPRKKKPIAKEKIVAKVKYCKQNELVNTVSANPLEVLDASAVMVYNVKNRKLGIYYAAAHTSISFKGTTLTGFDESKSVHKTMRKPAEQVPKLKKASKRSIQKEFDSINSVETKMNGRFNESILIVRVL